MTSAHSPRRRVSGSGGPDLPGPLPTRVPQDYHRLGSSTFLRPRIAYRRDVGRFVHQPEGRRHPLSNNALVWAHYVVVLEYQPVVHRLRLSASS